MTTVQVQAQAPAWQRALSGNNFQPRGTNKISNAYATATDAAGNVYVTGQCSAVTFDNIAVGNGGGMYVAKWNTATGTWAWVVTSSGGDAYGLSIAVSGGSVYVCGFFSGTTTVAGTSITSVGYAYDLFAAKFTDNGSSASGNWAVRGGYTGNDYANSIAVSGNSVYVTGQYIASDQYPATIAGLTLGGDDRGNNLFVLKLTDNGNSATGVWVQRQTGTNTAYGEAIGTGVATVGSNVYVTGHYISKGNNTGSFAGGPTIAGTQLNSTNYPYLGNYKFIAKYTDNGNSATGVWATGADGGTCNGIAVSGTSIYITGQGGGNIGGTFLTPQRASTFVAKYTDNGSSTTGVWARNDGGGTATYTASTEGKGIAVSGNSVYVIGSFGADASTQTALFFGTTIQGFNSTSVFVAKYTDNGSSVSGVWANSAGGTSVLEHAGIAVHGTRVYVACTANEVNSASRFGTTLVPYHSMVLGELADSNGSWQHAEFPLQGGSSITRATTTDAAGNVYITGDYFSTVGFGTTELASASPNNGTDTGNRDIFVAKWSASTGTWAWAVRGGGTGNDYANGIAVLGSNIYVTGSFEGSATLAGTNISSAGGTDVFVAKYTDAGATVTNGWAVRGGGSGDDVGTALAVSSGGVYVGGTFASGSSASLAGTALAGVGDTDVFVAKFVDAGSSATNGWARSGGGTGADQAQGLAVSGSNVYLTGAFSSSASIASAALTGGGQEMFVAKFGDTGSSATDGWARSGGGTGADIGNAIAVSGSNVYVAGDFTSGGAVVVAGTTLPGAGGLDAFVAKFVDAGSSATDGWARSGGGSTLDHGYALAVSGSRVYLGGHFTSGSPVSIAGTSLTGRAGRNVFVARYTDAGSSATGDWAQRSDGDGVVYGLAVSGATVYAAGVAVPNNTTDFGSFSLNNPLTTDINFLASLVDATVPAITSFTPPSGAVGTSVVLTGTGFTGATAVAFNGTTASSFVVNSATSITATVATGSSSGPISVTTPGGTATSSTSFVVTLPDLTVSSTQTISGAYNNVTITGAGVATLGGALSVAGTLTVQAGGTLHTACQALTGAGSFVLAAGATLGICDAAGISASGSSGAVQLAGSRSFSSDALYLYNGTTPQATGTGLPATVRELTLDNMGSATIDLTLSQGLALTQVLRLSNGNLSLGGHTVVLRSSAAGTALLVNTNGQVQNSTGTCQMERYIDPTLNAGAGYRHFSAPVTNMPLSGLTTTSFTPVFNPAYNTSATPALVTPFPTVFGYDAGRVATSPAVSSSAFDKGWYSPVATDVLTQATGYTVHVPASVLVTFSGSSFYQGASQGYSQPAGNVPEGPWVLVGNPYPAPFDLSTSGAQVRVNFDAASYVFESTGLYSGQYRAYVNGMGGASPLLAAGQGFFVHKTTPGDFAALGFNAVGRVTTFGSQPAFHRGASDARPQLTLHVQAGTATDALTIYAEAGATTGTDAAFDATKLANPAGLNLAALAATGEELAIQGLPSLAAGTVVPLTVALPAAAPATFTATLSNLPAGLTAFLTDAITGTHQNLGLNPTYTFLAAGSLAGRFALVFGPSAGPLATHTATAPTLALYPNPARTTAALTLAPAATARPVLILDALGREVRHTVLASQTATATLDVAGLPAGVYAIRCGAATTRLVVE
jgi:hypothetical protein